MKKLNVGLITRDFLEPEQESLVHVFMYMIGNTEYSVMRSEPNKDCCHNVELMAPKGESLYTPVAYDFDFAGMVNAPYAEPNPRYRLPNVRVRLFKGRCEYNEQLQSTIQFFHEKKDLVYETIDEQLLLTRISESSVRKYIDAFYDRIADPVDVKKWLVGKCYDPS